MDAERRKAEDGSAYTKLQFMEFYGGTAQWDSAEPVVKTSGVHDSYTTRWDQYCNEDNIRTGAVVHDNGSGMVKAGLSGDEEPQAHFMGVVGRSDTEPGVWYIGPEARSRTVLSVPQPLPIRPGSCSYPSPLSRHKRSERPSR